jgi:hypothetical protein
VVVQVGRLVSQIGRAPSRSRPASDPTECHKTGHTISFPVVVVDYLGNRYLVAMLGQRPTGCVMFAPTTMRCWCTGALRCSRAHRPRERRNSQSCKSFSDYQCCRAVVPPVASGHLQRNTDLAPMPGRWIHPGYRHDRFPITADATEFRAARRRQRCARHPETPRSVTSAAATVD